MIDIVVDARERYLAEFRKSATPEFHLEPVLRMSSGDAAVDGVLQLPMRVDLISRADGSTHTVSTPNPRPVARASREVSGTPISLEAPVWDALSVRLLSCAPRDFEPLRHWFHEWFDEPDENELNEEGGYGVVHLLSDPERVGDDTLISVDLGTAPLAAFEQLLVVLAGFQPVRIEITAG